MAKDNSNIPEKSGAPTALLVSIVSTIIAIAMAEIKNSFELADSFTMRYALFSFVGLGLLLAFFWKRLDKSPFLKIANGFYLFGLWVSLFLTTLGPVLLKGENPYMHGQVMQQFGFGFVAFSALMLVVSILQNQKMVPSLFFSALGAVGLIATGGAGFLINSPGTDEGSIAARSSGHSPGGKHGDDVEISSHGTSLAAKSRVLDEAEASEESEEKGSDDDSIESASGSHHNDHDSAASAIHEDNHAHSQVVPKESGKTRKAHDAVDEMAKEFRRDVDKHSASEGKEDLQPKKPQASPKPILTKEPKAKRSPVASLEHAIKSPKKSASMESELDWAYEAGPSSPEHWGNLADEYRQCSVGQMQSPIDIPSAWPTMGDVSLDYKLTPVSIVDTGRTIMFNVGKQNFARFGGKKYELVQFHIHTPSEHWIDGRSSPMEIHFVHKDDKKGLAVLSVMVEAGAEQKTFADLWGYVPQGLNSPAAPRGKIFNISTLVPGRTKVYRYRGSLTTPPCSENVLWSIASEKMTLSKEQIDAFRMRYKNNARPIQKRSTIAH